MFYVALITVLFVPIILMLFGWIMANSAGSPNPVFGYRTKASMRNQDTWNFANRFCGHLWLKWSMPLAIVSIVAICVFQQYKESITIVICVQLIPLFISIFLTEQALKKNFSEVGKDKHK